MSHESRHGYPGNDNGALTNGIALQTDRIGHPAQFMIGTAPYDNGPVQSTRMRHESCPPERYYSTPRGDPSLYPRHMSVNAGARPHYQHQRTHSDDIRGFHGPNPLPPSFVHPTANIGPSPYTHGHLTHMNGADRSANGMERSAFRPYQEEPDGAMLSRQYNVSEATAHQKEDPGPKNVELLTYRPLGEFGEEGMEREHEMTASQEQYSMDLDAKIKALYRARKGSEGGARPPKTKWQTPPTKEDMKSVMNMTPEKSKKKSKSETKKPARSSVYGTPGERQLVDRGREEGRKEKEALARKKFEKKTQRLAKTQSAVELLGYRRVEDYVVAPAIPEDVEVKDSGQWGKQPAFSPPAAKGFHNPSYLKSADTVSTASSFEFHSPFSPVRTSLGSLNRPSLSPTQELVEQMEIESPVHTEVHVPPKAESVEQSNTLVEGVTPQSLEKQEKGRVVYRQNLDDTCLDDVTVFGKHFDPSQLTQERMEGNFGDISMLGLNPEPLLPPKKKREEEGKEGDTLPSGSVRSDQKGKKPRSQSESSPVVPILRKDLKKKEKKEKKERDSERKKEKKAPKSKDSSISESFTPPQHFLSWDMQPPANISLPPYVTPSRHKMLRVSQSFREGPHNNTNDVFDPDAKGSMPNLHSLPRSSASSSLSPSRDPKEGTPDSSTSEEDKPTKRRSIGYSLGRKLSSSMRELFVAKERKNPTKRTTWYFAESSEMPQRNLGSSEPQVTALTEQERKNILEETEVIPRMRSVERVESEQPLPSDRPKDGNPLAHLFVPPADLLSKTDRMALLKDTEMVPSSAPEQFQERSVDGFHERSVDLPSSEQRRSSGARDKSDSEYTTASEAEEDYVRSSVNIITLPPTSDEVLREAGYYTSPKSVTEEKEEGEAAAGLQPSLPTIVERSPPPSQEEGPFYMMPPSEGDPILKTLDTVITRSPKPEREGEGSKKLKKGASKSPTTARAKEKEKEKEKGGKMKKEESKKEKKPMFSRFSKQRTAIHRNSPSPRSSSPATSSLSSDSRPSSGRFSPSQRPLFSSERGRQQSKSAQDSAKRGASDKKGGATGSPRGSLSISPVPRGRLSPTTQIPSPRAGGGTPLARKVSPSSKSPAASRLVAQNQSPDLSKRRVSTPATPTRSPLSIPKRTPSDRVKSTNSPLTGQGLPRPSFQPKSSTATPTVSRQSSVTSTVTPSSVSSSSPRMRRTGVSLPESPISPQKSFSQLDVPAPIGEETGSGSQKEPQDEVGKLLTSVGEKLAPLTDSRDVSLVESQTEPVSTLPHEEGKDQVVEEKRKRTRSVISALKGIGGRKTGKDSPTAKAQKTKPPSGLPPIGASPAAKSKAGNKSVSLTVTQTAKASPPGSKRWNTPTPSRVAPTATPGMKTSIPSASPTTAAKKPSPGASAALPPLPPASRKARPDGRSVSTIQPPSIKVTEARASIRRGSAAPSSVLSTGTKSSKLTAGSHSTLVRSSIRVSSKLKKNNPMSPEHRKVSTLTRPKVDDRTSPAHSMKSLPRTTTAARASMRKVSASPTGGRTAVQLPIAPRASMRRSSSGDALSNRNKAKQTQMGSLKKEKDRKASLAVLNASMRRTSTLQRPQAAVAGGTLNRNVATRSMRVSSSRKVSAMGTMPRASVVSRVGVPGPSGGDLQSSLARKSFKRTSSVKDAFAAFDEISAEAKGQQL